MLTYVFTRTISLIENIIDDESVVSHEQIAHKISQFIADSKAVAHFQSNNVISAIDFS